ncbi:MAG: hypothetical protein BA863_10775 [Desulfovibrio sp. S3730MH75]|nr:MAG: hypothetical protein BA863_10775 [Desulfovibrio sp. S3730MH75]
MTSGMSISKRSTGRVQYLGLRSKIEQSLAAGHSRLAVHGDFVEKGRLTLSYNRFCYYVNLYSSHCFLEKQGTNSSISNDQQLKSSVPASGSSPVALRSARPMANNTGLNTDSDKFMHPNTVTDEELSEKLIG